MGKTIAIDFDGVLHKYSKGWQDGDIYDEPTEGAIEALWKLTEKGYQVTIFTARADLSSVRQWIFEKVYECKAFTDEEFHPSLIEVTNIKPQAIAYIDDRAIRFTSWKDILNYF